MGLVDAELRPAATSRRYSPEQKDHAVRMVLALRVERGASVGTAARVARQLGCGVESVRRWVRQAETDVGTRAGVTSAQSEELRRLGQENRELRRANEIGQRAATFFG